jgi:hypothetical protein
MMLVVSVRTVFNYFGGGGMCEAACTGALECELTLRGHKVDRDVMVPVYYKGRLVARQRLDMVVDDPTQAAGIRSNSRHSRP